MSKKYSTTLQIEVITDNPMTPEEASDSVKNLERWAGEGLNIASVKVLNEELTLAQVREKDKFGYYTDEYEDPDKA